MGKPDWADINKRIILLEKDVADIKEAISKIPFIEFRMEK